MTVKVGINGFGRIGRQVLKAIRDYHGDQLEVVAFNDIGDLKTMAHLLKYDSNYGRFNGTVEVGEDSPAGSTASGQSVQRTDPANIPWGSWASISWSKAPASSPSRVDGVNKKGKMVKGAENHITKGGAKKVIITAPAKGKT
jgi:glyceraldehyde 3-phosphate dehydrogenase